MSANRLDRAIDITTNQSTRGTLIVEAKRTYTPRDADVFSQPLARQLRTLSHNTPILVVSEWLSQRARELLEEQGISYLDLTGNALIRLDNPAVFIRSMGSARAPKPVQRGTVRLRWPKAARVLRLLVDVRPPFRVREIASVTGVAVSYVSHLLEFLDQEALIERSKRGRVESVDFPRLLRRWGKEYDVFRTNDTRSYRATRGAQKVLEQIRGNAALRNSVVITGSFAAVRLAPVAAPALVAMYCDDLDELAMALDLLPADEGSNVALLRPYDMVVWDRISTDDGIQYAAPSQVGIAKVNGQYYEIPVDLIVPEAVAPSGGRRGARLGVHGNRAARRAVGLEAALVDYGPVEIEAFEARDGRTVGLTLATLCADYIAGGVSSLAIEYLEELFGRRGRVGIRMAAQALRLGLPEERVEALSVSYTGVLVEIVHTETRD
jgi:hypothetical protein